MNKIVVQFYNHIYYTYNHSLFLIYDTINNKCYTSVINKRNFTVQDGNIIIIDPVENMENKSLIETINHNHLGIVGGINDKYFKHNDYVSYLNKLNEYIISNSNNTHISTFYINEITVHMDSLYEPFTFTRTIEKTRDLNPINKGLLVDLFTKFTFKSLSKVKFIGAFSSYQTLKKLIYVLLDRCEVEYMCSAHEYTKIRRNMPKDLKLNLILDKTVSYQKLASSSSDPIKTSFIIEEESDIHFLKRKELYDFNEPSIVFSCAGSTNYLKHYLNYSIDDIFDSPISMDHIVKNELINELYWGKLTVASDGRLLYSPSKDMGNINNLDKINFCDLLEKKSLWMFNRKRNNHCNLCCYNCLCPPLSLVEIMSGQVFCNLNNNTV